LIRSEPPRIKLVKVEKDLRNTQEKIRGLVDKYVI
jgi:hypothetical protein